MRQSCLMACPVVLALTLLPAINARAAPATTKFSPAEQVAIFKAAGFARHGAHWKSDCGDPGTTSYSPGAIEPVGDLNGDGRPEAVVTEGGTYCYGMTGQGFWLLSKQANGAWKLLHSEIGVPEFLKTKGAAGWPDISIGGPGFCFPVVRWNGKDYVRNRAEYEGKPCKLPR